MKADYDTTLARIAGNIASGSCAVTMCVSDGQFIDPGVTAAESVKLARAIIAEVKRTEPAPYGGPQS